MSRYRWPSVEEARRRYEHGTHARYVLGRCRCFPCRVANSRYEAHRSEATREGEWDGKLIDVYPTVRHIRWLQSQGIGPKTVSKISGVSYSVLQRMLGYPSGRRRIYRTRVRTAERILAVTPRDVAGGQKIPAGPTWELIECLLSAGWRRWEVAIAVTPSSAARVGYGQRPGLQIRRDIVRASTAAKVRQVHDEAWRVDPRVRGACNHLTHGDDANAEAKRKSRNAKVAVA